MRVVKSGGLRRAEVLTVIIISISNIRSKVVVVQKRNFAAAQAIAFQFSYCCIVIISFCQSSHVVFFVPEFGSDDNDRLKSVAKSGQTIRISVLE